jgi:hypothetical protein
MNHETFEEAEASLTIREWCRQERCCESTFHRLVRNGLAPKTVRIGRSVRIIESRQSWHARMAQLESSRAKELERARTVAQTKAAVEKRWAKQKAVL